MALATNSTPGSIVLAGDLTGVANAPELRVTGVVPGSYSFATIVVDSKGRLVFAETPTQEEIVPYIGDATYVTKGILTTCDPQLSLVGGLLSLDMQLATTSLFGKVQAGAGLEIPQNDGVMHVSFATSSSKGIMQAGQGLLINAGVLSVGNIQVGEWGLVKIRDDVEAGKTIDVAGDGTISYAKPNATTSTKGVVQIGSGLSVTGGVVSLNAPNATTGVKGIVQIGDNIDVTAGVISVATATEAVKGVLQVGTGIGVLDGSLTIADATYTTKGLVQVQQNGGISVSGGVLSITTGSASVKGIVQVGTNIDVNAGVISVATATDSVKGVVQVGTNIDVTSGTISVATATDSVKGIVQVGTNIDVNAGVISVATATAVAKGIASFGSGLSVTGGNVIPDTTVLRETVASTTTVRQAKTPSEAPVTVTSISWSGLDGNIRYIFLENNITLNNGTNIQPNTYYHFVVYMSSNSTITYGSQFKFKSGTVTQPVGSTSVLSCYAIDANTLYCIMQPDFV